ncbi:MAG: glycosyltransferase, partial [Saprospiraceae bacterium]|nr:glycosyltransferase [Saprospiraceae bacterium]
VMMTADSPPDFISKIERLLDDADQQNRMAKRGRAYVEQHFDWHSCCAPLAELDQPQDVYKHENWQ